MNTNKQNVSSYVEELSKRFGLIPVEELVSHKKNEDTGEISFLNYEEHPLNRLIREDYVNKLANNVDWNKYPTIMINPNTGHILDGHHTRRSLLKALNMGIIDKNYLVSVIWKPMDEEQEAEFIQLINNGKHWTIFDFIDSYARAEKKKGFEGDYTRFKKFLNKNFEWSAGKIGPSLASIILCGQYSPIKIKNGTFSCSETQMIIGEHIGNQVQKMASIMKFSIKNTYYKKMANVWYKLFRNYADYDFERDWLPAISTLMKKTSFCNLPKETSEHWISIFREIDNEAKKMKADRKKLSLA